MTERKRLSLCLITHNDAQYLHQCLAAFKEAADEIIVADTGSDDQTIAIAKQAGASVYPIPWSNDFGAVKNFCLDHASGSWVLFLQPDEHISGEDIGKIRPLLANPNVEGYLLYIDYRSDIYGIFSPVQALRLIRNRQEYRYRYRSFEMIPDELLHNIEDCDILIKRRDDAVQSRQFQRRLLLLQEDLKEHREDNYLQYVYGITLLNEQKIEEGAVRLQQAVAGANLGYLYTPHLYKCLGWALLCLEKYDQALEALNTGVEYFPFYSDFLVLRGIVYKQKKDWGEAVQDLEKCLAMRERPRFLVPGPEIGIPVILETLAGFYEQNFAYRQALAYYLEADQATGTNDYLAQIGELSRITDEPGVMEDLIRKSIENRNAERLMIIIDIIFDQGEYAKVLAYIDKQEIISGDGDFLDSIKKYCRNMREVAEDSLHTIDSASPFYDALLLRRIENAWIKDRYREAEELLSILEQKESLGETLKSLYRSIHHFIKDKESSISALTEEGFRIIQGIYKHFFQRGQEEKAQILLPILLRKQDLDFYIALAEPWIKRGHAAIIRSIFQNASDPMDQADLMKKIIGRLLYYDHGDTAARLIESENIKLPEDLACILWAECQKKKLEQWLKSLGPLSDDQSQDTALPEPGHKPDQDLADFYHSLSINGDDLKAISEHMTNSAIHSEIGAYYEKNHQKEMALTAYLKALQWEPLNENAQTKIKNLSDQAPQLFLDSLEKTDCPPEGFWFEDKDSFINYIHGFINFYHQQFDRSALYFSKINETGILRSLIRAYTVAGLWLSGKESEIHLEDTDKTKDFITFIDQIIRGHLAERLAENRLRYPYSGLIPMEEEKIRKKSQRTIDLGGLSPGHKY